MFAKAKLYGPVVLSLLCLVAALYFSFSNSAYAMRGCREEEYPELGFILVIAPVAAIALMMSILSVRAKCRSRLRRYRIEVTVSLLLSILCILATLSVLFEAGGGVCV